jgi:hypothetical protein
MPNQIVLAWKVLVAGTSFGPAAAAAAIAQANAPLYVDPTTDPVLGQLFALTVASDLVTSDAVSATRALTLNMTSGGPGPNAVAPPPFPCRPITSTPPVLPFALRRAVTLPGSLFVTNGSTAVATTATQLPALSVGDSVQFLSQQGVFYTVAPGITPTGFVLATPFTGVTGNTGAFREVAAPAIAAAIYSTSPLDTAGVATTPAIPAGPGAIVVGLRYLDSTGAGPFTVGILLTGKRPAAVVLAGGSKDIAVIVAFGLVAVGAFGNSIGQITLCELGSALPPIPATTTLDQFAALTDQAQLSISRHLAYLPPSYFALAQQNRSAPALAGDFFVTTGSANVPTNVDQTGALAPGNVIQFAAQPEDDTPFGSDPVTYTVQAVSPKQITLTSAFTGLGPTNNFQAGTGVKGTKSVQIANFASAARRITPSPAVAPTNAQLAAPLGQFVATEVAAPPPNPPLPPSTVPLPTFLSDLFTQTLQLKLAGVPIQPQAITFV